MGITRATTNFGVGKMNNNQYEYAIAALHEYAMREKNKIFAQIGCFLEYEARGDFEEYLKNTDWSDLDEEFE